MATKTEGEQRKGPWAWLSSRAGLIILVVIGAIVGWRLMSSWIKWTLIAMVAAAIYYLVKGATRPRNDGSKDTTSDEG